MPSSIDLPPVENWWPHLEIPAKHWLVAHLDEPVPAWIVSEIRSVSHVPDPGGEAEYTLSAGDRGYIVTQTEMVD